MIVDTPDRVWHFTSTGWTAIGSIVAAVSVVALVVFNWRYLRLTHALSQSTAAQAVAAQTQAAIAQESLKKLEEQISSDLLTKRHAALAVLQEAQNRIRYWISNFRSQEVAEPIRLRPDWNVLVADTSHHLPEAYASVAIASQELHVVELDLNRLVAVPSETEAQAAASRCSSTALKRAWRTCANCSTRSARCFRWHSRIPNGEI